VSKSCKATPERINLLRHRVHKAALRVLLGKEPCIITDRDIENNAGRINKALRVLFDQRDVRVTTPIILKSADYGYGYGRKERIDGYWTDSLDEYVESYASKAPARHFEECLRKDLEGFMGSNEEKHFSHAGWREFKDVSLAVLAHIWIHRDEYLFMGPKKKSDRWNREPSDTPIPWDECTDPGWFAQKNELAVQTKLILRNAAEMYAREHFHDLSRRDTGLPGATYATRLDVTIPNIGGVPLTKDNLDDTEKLCDEALNAITRYRKGCRAFKAAVESHGGEKGYRLEIMRRAVQDMLDMAPVVLADHNNHDHGTRDMARYAAQHGRMVDHDALFDDRDPIMLMRTEDRESPQRQYYGIPNTALDTAFNAVLALEDDML